jgi:hypothetical protein
MVNFTAGSVLTASALNTAFNAATINAQTGTSYTFGTADAGELVTLSNASGGTATIPANSTWGAATGTIVSVMNAGTAGSWTIGTAAGVTLNAVSGTTVLAPLEAATLVKLATNTWQLAKGSGLPKATYSSTTGSPTVTTVSGKTCVQFTGSGSITVNRAGMVRVLGCGGGGAGGTSNGTTYSGGGGGAGAYIEQDIYLPVGTHTITVGSGGSGSAAMLSLFQGPAGQGNTSLLGTYLALPGGGVGGGVDTVGGLNPFFGGCGGGSYFNGSQAAGLTGFGNSGGLGPATVFNSAGGGGGAGAVGSNSASTTVGGAGGAGISSSITGSSVARAGGGGGSGSGGGGAGGSGGGGAGGTAGAGTSGTANTGGGGGGARVSQTSGSGGSGLVTLLFG